MITLFLGASLCVSAQDLDRGCPCDRMAAKVSIEIQPKKVDCLELHIEYGAEGITFKQLADDLHRLSASHGCEMQFGHLPIQTDKIPRITFDRRRRSVAEILAIALSRTDLDYCVMGQHTQYVCIIKR